MLLLYTVTNLTIAIVVLWNLVAVCSLKLGNYFRHAILLLFFASELSDCSLCIVLLSTLTQYNFDTINTVTELREYTLYGIWTLCAIIT